MCLVAWLPSSAWAGGVLIRFQADRVLDGEVVVTLSPEGGESVELTLLDNGSQPDVTAGDGLYAGAGHIAQASAAVALQVGDDRYDGGTVAWSSADVPRDLDLALKGDTLVADAREATMHSGGDAGGGGPGTSGAAAGAVAGAEEADDGGGVVLIGVGSGLLAVLGAVFFAARMRAAPAPAVVSPRLTGVTRVPEGPLAGPGSPSLSDGLLHATIELPEEHAGSSSAVLARLVAWLSAHHTVLVVGDDLPDNIGGDSVLACSPASPARIGDRVDALLTDGGPDVAVVFVGVEGDSQSWEDHEAELPEGCGGVVVHESPETAAWVLSAAPHDALVLASRDSDARFVLPPHALW